MHPKLRDANGVVREDESALVWFDRGPACEGCGDAFPEVRTTIDTETLHRFQAAGTVEAFIESERARSRELLLARGPKCDACREAERG